MKIPFKPGTLIYPLPAVMVTCGDCEENYNIITIGWTGTICSDPPMCYISVRKERHSHELIMKNKGAACARVATTINSSRCTCTLNLPKS